jgi:Tol biopolymer transport system component
LPVPFTGAPKDGTRLTTTDARLVPESAAYAPDGRRIGYVLRGADTGYELWSLRTTGDDLNGVPIAERLSHDKFAFDASAQRALVTRSDVDTGASYVGIVATDGGGELAQFGLGQTGNEAWHPDENYVAVAAPDARGRPQIWAVETKPPHRRQQLTMLENGIRGFPAVSRDGEWIAAIGDTERASMVFLDTAVVTLDGSRHE